MNSVVDTDLLDRRFPPIGPDAPAPVLDAFVQAGFVEPAIRLLVRRVSLPDRQSAESWMAWINDRAPGWRLREPVQRFCTSRRREALVSACVRERYADLVSALEDRRAIEARGKEFVEALRRGRKIARITGQRMVAGAVRDKRDALFIIRRLTTPGGIERSLITTVNSLASAGKIVDLLVLGETDPTFASEIDGRVRVVNLGAALRTCYRAGVNFSQWHFPEVLTRGIHAKRRLQWIQSDLQQIFNRYPRNLYAREYKRVQRFICVSEFSRDGFARIYPGLADRVTAIQNFYEDETVLRKAAEEPETRLLRSLPSAITVARLVEPKGIERAVRVHRRLADEGVDFRWYIVGDGTMRRELEEAILRLGLRDRFILLGPLRNPFALMRQADVFVLPSYHEGYPVSALEAKTLRMPIVLSDFGSAREIIRDGVDGLVAPNSERGIAGALGRLLRDGQLRDRFRSALDSFHHDNASIRSSIEAELFPSESP